MARLNEPPVAPPPPPPPPSTEAFDAIKRKFMRTNRELAKINSQQQVHIRTLENERSRLVAENCSLAQRVIHLQNTLEAQAHAPSLSTIDTVKGQLEAKIQELGGLVAELGQLHKKDGREAVAVKTATRKSPDERQWKSALGLQEVENAMLPTITEHKAYPRMTMNAEELQDILDAPDSQSPDIGPPPVSRFDIEEPITFKHSPSARDQPDQAVDGEEVVLPMNLETRRKRRESGPKLNTRRMSLFESPEETDEVPVKKGAKRKFSVQEDEDKGQAEGFHFNRRGTSASVEENTEVPSNPLSPRRPILSSKPVNTDPVVSPKKQRSSASEKPEKLEKPTRKPSGRPRTTAVRNLLPDIVPQEPLEPIPTTEIHLESLPPKTPAAEAILSPPSTEPSASRPESKDTPPPGDLSMGSQTGIIGRPSRRARPQVSYKEPSLNTKMRRPSKELVDAVIVDHSRRTSVEPPTPAPNSANVIIKEEPGESPWRPLGAVSSLRGGDGAEAGSPLRQKADRDRKESGEERSARQKLNSSAAERAIEKMIEETSTAKRKSLTTFLPQPTGEDAAPPQSKEPKASGQQETKGEMAIFDFNDSSPPANAPAKPDGRPKISLASAVRDKRRHSAVPAPTATEDRRADSTSKQEGGLPAVHRRTVSGTSRPAPAAGLAKSTASARASMKERERERERRNVALPSSGSATDLRAKDSGAEGVRESREARAASRRKSMML
ncbi:shugoshin [Bimuria novae-zelandiae CBS 107.79]|uniref:Shugoshin n=1 Tax=Bimuria novae-zelandiae CBS 107.79 TaxID=1447943 RepID=A0A6A5UJ82_9PLEO|nr:shugoshin [Bimuria novae-zelandiae CBS 107.79]